MPKFEKPKIHSVRAKKVSSSLRTVSKCEDEEQLSSGFVYAAINQCMPGLTKIGCSSFPRDRMAQLFQTGVPDKFAIAWQVRVSHKRRVESSIHEYLKPYRKRSDREFFYIDAGDAYDKIFKDVNLNEFVSEDLGDMAGKTLIYRPNTEYSCKIAEQGYFDFDRYAETWQEWYDKPKDMVLVPETAEEAYLRVTSSGDDEPMSTLRSLTRKLMGSEEYVNPLPFWIVKETGELLHELL